MGYHDHSDFCMGLKKPKKEILEQISQGIERLKDKKGFLRAGARTYNRLFGRDSLISAWQLLDFYPNICRATLEILSQYQGKIINKEREEEPGKILHEADLKLKYHPKCYFPFPYYGSVDSTPLYLIVFSFYYQKTKDKKFLNRHWENILLAVKWMMDYGDKDKDLFLEYKKKNPKGLFHQGWKDNLRNHLKINPPVALVEVQGYQYLSLKKISGIAKEMKDFDLAKELVERAEKLKEKFNKDFWWKHEKYFVLALDGNKRQRKAVTSNPGHLLFTDIVEKEKIDFVVRRLFQDDLWTPYGIRTLSTKDPDFDPQSYHLGSVWPHDNWIIAQGLRKIGYKEEYQKIKQAILKAYNKLGLLPEYYGVIDGKITIDLPGKPNYLQAWSLGALFNFLKDRHRKMSQY